MLSQAVRGVLQLGRNFGNEIIGQRLERDTRHELYASLIGKSMTFHDQQTVGDVMARATNDVHMLNLMFSPGLMLILDSAMAVVVPLFMIARMGAGLLAVPLVFLIVYPQYWLLIQPAYFVLFAGLCLGAAAMIQFFVCKGCANCFCPFFQGECKTQ